MQCTAINASRRRGGVRGGAVSRRRSMQAVASRPRVALCVRSTSARDRTRDHGRQRPSHGVRGDVVAAPRHRRLRGALGARRLQLGRAASAAQLRPLQEPPRQGGAERPQALLHLPALHVREVPADGGPAARDGDADGSTAGAGAGRGARAAPVGPPTGHRAGAAGAAHGEGAAQPHAAAAALRGLDQLRLSAGLSRRLPLRLVPAAVRSSAAGDAASVAASTAW